METRNMAVMTGGHRKVTSAELLGSKLKKLQDAAFETYVRSYIEEVLADRLVRIWQGADEFTKVLVAVTTSGSAVSGWTLWNDNRWRPLWAVMAGTGALLSVIHATLGVPDRIKSWAETKQVFSRLRIDIGAYRRRMNMSDLTANAVAYFEEQLEKYSDRYAEGMSRKRNDFLETKKRSTSAEAEVDDLIDKETEL